MVLVSMATVPRVKKPSSEDDDPEVAHARDGALADLVKEFSGGSSALGSGGATLSGSVAPKSPAPKPTTTSVSDARSLLTGSARAQSTPTAQQPAPPAPQTVAGASGRSSALVSQATPPRQEFGSGTHGGLGDTGNGGVNLGTVGAVGSGTVTPTGTTAPPPADPNASLLAAAAAGAGRGAGGGLARWYGSDDDGARQEFGSGTHGGLGDDVVDQIIDEIVEGGGGALLTGDEAFGLGASEPPADPPPEGFEGIGGVHLPFDPLDPTPHAVPELEMPDLTPGFTPSIPGRIDGSPPAGARPPPQDESALDDTPGGLDDPAVQEAIAELAEGEVPEGDLVDAPPLVGSDEPPEEVGPAVDPDDVAPGGGGATFDGGGGFLENDPYAALDPNALDDPAAKRLADAQVRQARAQELAAARAEALQEVAARAGLGGFGLSGATSALMGDVNRAQTRSAIEAMDTLARQQRQETLDIDDRAQRNLEAEQARRLALDEYAREIGASIPEIELQIGMDLDGDGATGFGDPTRDQAVLDEHGREQRFTRQQNYWDAHPEISSSGQGSSTAPYQISDAQRAEMERNGFVFTDWQVPTGEGVGGVRNLLRDERGSFFLLH